MNTTPYLGHSVVFWVSRGARWWPLISSCKCARFSSFVCVFTVILNCSSKSSQTAAYLLFFSKQHFNHHIQDIDIAQAQVLDRGIIKPVWATNKNRVLHQCLLTFDSFPVFLSVQELSVIVWTQYYISCNSNYVFHIILFIGENR